MKPRNPVARWLRKFFRDEEHWEDLNFLRGISIFKGIHARQLGRLRLSMQKRAYRTGEILFREGQTGRAVFIIRSGQVELIKTMEDGSSRRLGVLGSGQIFGEMALLENRPRTASATVIEDSMIYLLYTATVEALVRRHPSIGVKLFRNMAVMLSALLRKSTEQSDRRLQVNKKAAS